MARVTNPLMSFDAEGQLGQKGNGVVYKTYRGEKIAVLPPPEHNDSRSAQQMVVRGYFKAAVESWKAEASSIKTLWSKYANDHGMVQSGYNVYVGKYIEFLLANSGTPPTVTNQPPNVS